MNNLTQLTIICNATNNHLALLYIARPPLELLDLTGSKEVTCKGIENLLGVQLQRSLPELSKVVSNPRATLMKIRLVGTSVEETGVVLALGTCPRLQSITGRCVQDALEVMKGFRITTLNLTRLDIKCITPMIVELCPSVVMLDVHLLLLQHHPLLSDLKHLTHLTLAPRESSESSQLILLSDLLTKALPGLSSLTIENVNLTVPSSEPLPTYPSSTVSSLRIMCCQMKACAIRWVLLWAQNATTIRVGSCENVHNQHIQFLIDNSILGQVKELGLIKTTNLTEDCLLRLVRHCKDLNKLHLYEWVSRSFLEELDDRDIMICTCYGE